MAYRVEVPRSSPGLRVSLLTLVAVAVAGCSSDVTRFNESPFASRSAPAASEVTGSIPAAPAGRVERQPLPQTQAALPPPPPKNTSATGTSAGAGGLGAYRPPPASGDITGSVSPAAPAHAAQAPQTVPAQPPRVAAAAPQQPQVVTLAPGETVAVLSRRYGVPMGAIIKANNLTSPNDVKIGQRLVIPRQGSAPVTTQAPATLPAAPAHGGFHVAGPGDTLLKIAQRYRVSVPELARANNLAPNAAIKRGDRLAIPAQTSAKATPAQRAEAAPPKPQQQAQPAPAPQPPQQMAAAEPPHTANLASPTVNPEAEAKADAGGALFRWPVRGRIVAAFGAKPNGQQNNGINIAVPEGTPIKAAEEGEVAYAGNELKGYGNLILLRHPNGFVTAYAHASELMVKRGEKVKRGQVIGKSGRTGAVSAPQLHFEIRKGSTPVDPMPYLGA